MSFCHQLNHFSIIFHKLAVDKEQLTSDAKFTDYLGADSLNMGAWRLIEIEFFLKICFRIQKWYLSYRT